jgi:hypothetical protein
LIEFIKEPIWPCPFLHGFLKITVKEKGNEDGAWLTDPGILTCTISNNYSRFLWQQASGNTAFSANQDTAITEGAHNIHRHLS